MNQNIYDKLHKKIVQEIASLEKRIFSAKWVGESEVKYLIGKRESCKWILEEYIEILKEQKRDEKIDLSEYKPY